MRHRHALALLVASVAVFFAGPLCCGYVIYPHDNSLELGAPPVFEQRSNRKFSDESSYFVPELHHHLQGDRSGWISSWNPHVELGRPTSQLGAVGKAFWLTHLLSTFSSDALRVYTWQTTLAVLSIGIFALLLFRARGLHPAASLAGALGLCLGVFPTYWLTFGIFLWGIAFTLAVLWLIEVGLREPTLLRGCGLAFAVHGLLLSAYPQQIVWHFYVVVVYVLVALTRHPGPPAGRARSLAFLGCSGLVGLLSVAPTYADLVIRYQQSVRLDAPADFLVGQLPAIEGWRDILVWVTQWIDAGLFGNPIAPGYPADFDGLALTPLHALLVAASFSGRRRWRLLPWQLFVAAAVGLTLWQPAYRFGVEHLGLSLSAFLPLAGALVPAAVLAAEGADRILRGEVRGAGLACGFSAVLVALAGLNVVAQPLPLSAAGVAGAAVSTALALAFVLRRTPRLLIVAAMLGVLLHSWPLRLWRPPEQIRRDSVLVEMFRRHTADGSRFARIDNAVIPSNQEVQLGLFSIHSYNPLSSRHYRSWVLRISPVGPASYGRRFYSIRGTSRLSRRELAKAGIGLLASKESIDPQLAARVGAMGPLKLYRLHEKPLLAAQWAADRTDELARAATLPIRRIEIADDRLRFELTDVAHPTLLFVSQQYHPQWRASAGSVRLDTVLVDEFYQGVLVPAHTRSVELWFAPWVRHAWIPQLLFAAGLPACVLWDRRRRREAGRDR